MTKESWIAVGIVLFVFAIRAAEHIWGAMEVELIGLLQMPTPSFGGFFEGAAGQPLWQEILGAAMLILFGLCVLVPVLYIIFAKHNDENS